MNRIRVKICGLTIPEQVKEISDIGADAIGFMLYPKSPRFVSLANLPSLISQVGVFTHSVGVVVNEKIDFLTQVHEKTNIDMFQLHGDESPAYCQELTNKGIKWIKAVRMQKQEDIQTILAYPKGTFLVDIWDKDKYGGTGKEIPENWLTHIPTEYNVILAGGISVENVEQKLTKVRPYGIDLSSSLESQPGVKDIEKTKRLFDVLTHWQQTNSINP